MSTIRKSLGVILGFVILYLVIQNVEDLGKTVTISVFGSSLSLKAGFWFVVFYLFGMVTWMYFDLSHILEKRKAIAEQKKEIKRLGEELQQYRNQALEESESVAVEEDQGDEA